ncbi:MAG: YraN family protein [Candidatus Kapaibacteriota bacterium]
MNKSNEIGKLGEQTAENYLIGKGYKIVKKNFHFGKLGEIDIIAEKDGKLIFLEVKVQKSDNFGDPHFWITPAKQNRLRKVAEGYLYINGIKEMNCQFDAIFIDLRYNPPLVDHIENAF